MPQTQDGSTLADATGPSASVEFGKAGQVQQQANSLKNNAPDAYRASKVPGQGSPQGAPGVGPGASPGEPVGPQGQPTAGAPDAQPQPFQPQDMAQGGRVFPTAQTAPAVHWLPELNALAQSGHYPTLQALARLGNAHREASHGGPAAPDQHQQ